MLHIRRESQHELEKRARRRRLHQAAEVAARTSASHNSLGRVQEPLQRLVQRRTRDVISAERRLIAAVPQQGHGGTGSRPLPTARAAVAKLLRRLARRTWTVSLSVDVGEFSANDLCIRLSSP